ncbi:NSS family neurotransmitter:Na+ symporter [Paenibacillus phyllosphaerae]|uniref:Transporter n=1 Tax=Paenibacillus phyllosphaerae TaxID=274593 RepID=A0A7W5AXM2_9BACL|nr:sodium-dependent transporter [Paenibacillus phyllosphaerae]MBB3110659.1 NSS family neurotransmitter:Na+ symporter [Paenibacillus phyllosphaerae]
MNLNKGSQNQEGAGGSGGKSSDQFSRYGFILAAIGSAVGLGNMWKFPYITGKYGGAAFFLVFIICLIAVGLPVLLAEMAIGRGGRGNASTSMVRLSGKKSWGGFGFISIFGSFMIFSYYAVVAGWTLHYAYLSFTGQLFGGADFGTQFGDFIGGYLPVFYQLLVVLLTAWVVAVGISSGIERFNKILIPGLVVLLILLVIRSLTLDGAGAGVEFFLNPDFSKLSPTAVLVALGHAFFSLSLGMGVMITYGAYVSKQQSLSKAALAVGFGDLLYAFLAGLIIFPTTFAFNLEPAQGPGLVFVVLPTAFEAMPFGALFGGLFFILLAVAALTSAVSLLEVPVAYVMEKWKMSRTKAVWMTAIICFIVGLPSALSVGGAVSGLTFGGKTFFDWMDFLSSNVLLPVGGLVVTLFAGWVWKDAYSEADLTPGWYKVWKFALRWVAPILVVLVLLISSGVISE